MRTWSLFLPVILLLGGAVGSQPSATQPSTVCADTLLINSHLTAITKTNGYRNYQNLAVLNQAAEYILSVFKKYADTAYFQPYNVNGRVYKNVIASFGNPAKARIIVGAHYDVCGEQEGADDNASGVVGLLELARMLHGKNLEHTIEIVAYSLEEPPFFRTTYMGSYVHARALKESNANILGMVTLEMIGLFSDKKKSQSYPVKAMKVAYGNTGDYILLAKRSGAGKFVTQFSDTFKALTTITAKSIKTPAKMLPIDFSDHLNYWEMGYDALMITNTAFYRNKNYHQTSDTMETLDIPRMAKVIDTLYNTLISL